jgi:hypothetical protein
MLKLAYVKLPLGFKRLRNIRNEGMHPRIFNWLPIGYGAGGGGSRVCLDAGEEKMPYRCWGIEHPLLGDPPKPVALSLYQLSNSYIIDRAWNRHLTDCVATSQSLRTTSYCKRGRKSRNITHVNRNMPRWPAYPFVLFRYIHTQLRTGVLIYETDQSCIIFGRLRFQIWLWRASVLTEDFASFFHCFFTQNAGMAPHITPHPLSFFNHLKRSGNFTYDQV